MDRFVQNWVWFNANNKSKMITLLFYTRSPFKKVVNWIENTGHLLSVANGGTMERENKGRHKTFRALGNRPQKHWNLEKWEKRLSTIRFELTIFFLFSQTFTILGLFAHCKVQTNKQTNELANERTTTFGVRCCCC